MFDKFLLLNRKSYDIVLLYVVKSQRSADRY